MSYHPVQYTAKRYCLKQMTVRDVWSQGITKMIRNPDSHTVRKGLTPHPIVRTSEIPASQAADSNGSPSHGERPDPNTYPAVWSLPHRNNLPSTNQHTSTTAWHFIPCHPVPYTPKYYRSKQTTTTDVGSQGIQKMKNNPKPHKVRKCLTLHPTVKTKKNVASQAVNNNGSLSHMQRSYPNTRAAVGSTTPRTHLSKTNQHTLTTAWLSIPNDPVPHTKKVPFQINDGYRCWISRYPKNDT